MTDIALQQIGAGFDIGLSGSDVLADDGLETAVILSLYVDRRATEDDELPDNTLSRGGFFGDAIAEIANDQRGSRLWLLRRETRRDVVLEKARTYCREALQWLLEDGVASSVDIATAFLDGIEPGETVLQIVITIYQPTGGPARFKFAYNWESQLFSRVQ